MGTGKDVQSRIRKAAGPAEQASRSSSNARKAAEKKKKAVEAEAAARATFQASLFGGSRPRASGAGSSSQDNGHVEAASESTEPAAAGDRAVGSAEHRRQRLTMCLSKERAQRDLHASRRVR